MSTSAETAAAKHVVRAACPHDCPDTCALLVTVEDGIATEVKGNPDHPTTAGVLCTKVSRYAERTYHPERLLYPMRRIGAKGEGKFARISWDEALHTIASRLQEIAARDAQAIVPYSYAGTMGVVQGESMATRFLNRLGASELKRTICSAAGATGYKYTIGARIGTELEAFSKSSVILIWGGNPIASNLHFWMRAQEAKRNGATLVAIDPYRSLTAEKCHMHLAPLPGTDSALALGLMHLLIEEDWLDHDYIAQYTLGFEALRERVREWTPERTAEVCGLEPVQIVQLARLYGSAAKDGQAVAIRVNYGLQRTHGGGMAVRNIACLPALVGAWRHAAGGIQLSASDSFAKNQAWLQRPDLFPAGKKQRHINMSTIGDDLLKPASPEFGPQIEALIVYNSNPVAVAPESAKVAQGFAREDLFTVVLEHFQTDTCDYADIILPATTQLEHVDVHATYGHTYMMANNQAIAPLGEAKPNSEIFRLLARAMGFHEDCFADSDETLAAHAFKREDARSSHFDWEVMKREGWQKLNMPAAPFAKGGFKTPSGKCEFYSETMAKHGLDPLPAYIGPHESAATTPELAARYPLAMISPPQRNFLNSTFVNVKSLRDTEGEPHLELHPDEAAKRGLQHGDLVRAFNDRGSMQAVLRVTDKVRPGLLVGLSIWWKKYARDGKNVNELTSQRVTDMGEGPTFYDVLVEVEKVK
ncbi:molybdopterin oxidoreductase family protein [Massilia sp. W12]|uniref:molybdopterin-containing oxidoreductase family protein n=1 Tax=Massilia sp. W12 TaxID=3126507 RepID=UPI0030CB0FB7